MSDLTFLEKNKLEKRFEMADGYVLGFSDRTFQEFVADICGENIYECKYDYRSGSKANRLRAFWKREPNHVVGRLVAALLELCASPDAEPSIAALHEECTRIAERLLQGAPVLDVVAISALSGDREFNALARAVKASIDNNEPEAGLDRLHTFAVKYIRTLCEKRGIAFEIGKPLHSLLGEYVKTLRSIGLVQSEMTVRILKSTISTLEAFNQVRNQRSLAHDNPMLNYSESLLIFNHVTSTIRFLGRLEQNADQKPEPTGGGEIDDMPF